MKTVSMPTLGKVLILALALYPLAAEKPVLCVYTEYNPANFADEEGNHTGFFVDIARELFERRLGYRLEFRIYPWARCQTMLERGEADFIMTIPTDERLKYSRSVLTPILMKQYRIVTLRDHPRMKAIESIRSRNDLAASGFSVLSYLGHNWSKERLEAIGIPVINAPTVDGMYNMLLAKRGDILVEDTLLAQTFILVHKLQERLIITGGIVDESTFHILIGEKSQLIKSFSRISDALREMKADGTIDHITSQYAKQ